MKKQHGGARENAGRKKNTIPKSYYQRYVTPAERKILQQIIEFLRKEQKTNFCYFKENDITSLRASFTTKNGKRYEYNSEWSSSEKEFILELQAELRERYLLLEEDERVFFKTLDYKYKWKFCFLEKRERVAFRKLSPNTHEEYLGLSHLNKELFLLLNDIEMLFFFGLKQEQKNVFLTLDKRAKGIMMKLDSENRDDFLSLSPLHRELFLLLDPNKWRYYYLRNSKDRVSYLEKMYKQST